MIQQWEYKTSPTVGTDLVSFGKDGWELVCVDGASMHFKRPVDAAALDAASPAAEDGAFFGSRPEPIANAAKTPSKSRTSASVAETATKPA